MGIDIRVENDNLRIRAQTGVFTDDVRKKITEKKAEIITYLNQPKYQSSNDSAEIANRPDKITFPMSFSQERIWFLEHLDNIGAANNSHCVFRIDGAFNVDIFENYLKHEVERHEILRTTFEIFDGKPVQVVHRTMKIDLHVMDYSGYSSFSKYKRCIQWSRKFLQKRFDLSNGPLFRIIIFRFSTDYHLCMMIFHKCICDYSSILILFDEIAEFSKSYIDESYRSNRKPVSIQFKDFCRENRDFYGQSISKEKYDFWKAQLDGKLDVLQFANAKKRPPIQSYNSNCINFKFSLDQSKTIKIFSEQFDVPISTILVSIYALLLHRYSMQQEIMVGLPSDIRSHYKYENTIGNFNNTNVLRCNFAGNPTFVELIESIKNYQMKITDNQDFPIELLIKELTMGRNLEHSPLFQAMFTYDRGINHKIDCGKTQFTFAEPGNLLNLTTGKSLFDLTLNVQKYGEVLKGQFIFSTDLFEKETIERMCCHLKVIIEKVAVDPNQRVCDFSLLSEKEQQQILIEWNSTSTEYPKDEYLHRIIEKQVKISPNKIALRFNHYSITYHELNNRANQLARYLRKNGVKSNSLVGLSITRSIDMVVGLLGILKSGAAYVPLDPEFPKDRLSFMINDANLTLILSEDKLRRELPPIDVKVILMDKDWHKIALENKENLEYKGTGSKLAYTIYTSGSTGLPKGVQITHQALLNFLFSMQKQPGLIRKDKLLAVTTICFDISGLEIFLPLITGAEIIIANAEDVKDGNKLRMYLDSGITVMQATPATWNLLLASKWQGNQNLKVLCGGEALPIKLAKELLERSASVWNVYGPTETTIWSSINKINNSIFDENSEDTSVSIGKPIDNTQIYILDEYLNSVPVGIPGEIHIGGDGLALGYLNRSDLTQQKFIENPLFKNHSKLYKTGDLARFLADGQIRYLGRLDHQVKVRGYRIELGEIETFLNKYPDIKNAIVSIVGENNDDKKIVAYLIAKNGRKLDWEAIRNYLSRYLPRYMLPSNYVKLEKFPLTPNGKIDRKSLPIPESSNVLAIKSNIMPRNIDEKRLAKYWCDSLNIEKVGIDDNFFDIGGHSLMMIKIHSMLEKDYKRQFSVVDLFHYPTIRTLAKFLGNFENDNLIFSENETRLQKQVESLKMMKVREQR